MSDAYTKILVADEKGHTQITFIAKCKRGFENWRTFIPRNTMQPSPVIEYNVIGYHDILRYTK